MEEVKDRILHLKESLHAVIVAHNYELPEVQDVADFVGDSLELSRKCTEVDADVIVFCGVRFMAETAAIVNPQRQVLLSEAEAGCPLADMVDVPTVKEWKAKCPGAAVVCYVNSTAEVKAESDICCTSANAVKVVNSLPNDDILFIPDYNLGHYASTKTEKHIILYPGFCPPHQRVKPQHIERAKEQYPDGVVLVHPECAPEVVALADAALSTSQILRYVNSSPAKTFLIGTEQGLLHRMRQENPDKSLHLLTNELLCQDMKKTTLNSVVRTMEERRNTVVVPEEVRVRAKVAIDRMLALP
ncbi:MAG: quinolinate synthase NadA [Chloroflexota bacterium]